MQGSPDTDFSKIRLRNTTIPTQWPPQTHAEGGQGETMLSSWHMARLHIYIPLS